jgi:catechol 2,3-dioxygenase-like lactoylglutathione lyase family enzyme
MMRLHHAAVGASSEKNADTFFHDLLGLKRTKASSLNRDLAEKIFDVDADCGLLLYGNEDFAVEVIVADPLPAQEKTFSHICLEVANRDRFIERSQEKGLEINLVPKGDALLCFIRDFDGNLYEVKG